MIVAQTHMSKFASRVYLYICSRTAKFVNNPKLSKFTCWVQFPGPPSFIRSAPRCFNRSTY